MSEALTREEKFLAAAAGENVEIPEPVTRREQFLAAIAKKGGGKSGLEYFNFDDVTDEMWVEFAKINYLFYFFSNHEGITGEQDAMVENGYVTGYSIIDNTFNTDPAAWNYGVFLRVFWVVQDSDYRYDMPITKEVYNEIKEAWKALTQCEF